MINQSLAVHNRFFFFKRMLEYKQNKNILLLGDFIVLFQTKTPSNQTYMVSSTKKFKSV